MIKSKNNAEMAKIRFESIVSLSIYFKSNFNP